MPDHNALLKRSVHLVREFGTVNMNSIHGPSHWRNVEATGVYLAKLEDQDPLIPRLFALFHDFLRVNDGFDPEHGPRAAEFLRSHQSKFPELSNQDLEVLAYACEGHTWGQLTDDPLVGICWDADRLDLGRVGIVPDPRFFSTSSGHRLASNIFEFGDYDELEKVQRVHKGVVDELRLSW